MLTTVLSAAMLCSLALNCPTTKTASDCSGSTTAVVQNVALESKAEAKSDCPLACSGEKSAAVVQTVGFTAEPKADCATPCDSKASAFATPAIAYRVADKDMACPVSAKAMAAEKHADVQFVVQGVAYQSEPEAKAAHAAAMEQYTDSLTRVAIVVNGQKVECADKAAACKDACDSTKVQYQVGPAMFDDAAAAVRAAAAAHAALQSVKMTYAVNGETTACSVDAAKKSSACGKGVEYVVNGQTTPCDQTAKYLLTQERMAAAVAAVQKTIG